MKGLFRVLAISFLLTAFNEECLCGEYVYPVRPGTPEWDSLDSYAARIDACNIPEGILQRMNTGDLLKVVLKHPYIMNLIQYETIDGGISHMENQFNGLRELFNRAEASEIILEKYLEFLSTGNLDLICLLETLMCQEEMLAKLTPEKLKNVLNETYDSFKTRVNSESYLKIKSYATGGLLLSRILIKLNSPEFINRKSHNSELEEFLNTSVLKNQQILSVILIETIEYINSNGEYYGK